MARPSRSQLLWNEAKRSAAQDIRGMIEEQAPRVAEALQELASTITAQRTLALQGKAPRDHIHVPSEVTGLPAAVGGLNARVTALETLVETLEARIAALETQ